MSRADEQQFAIEQLLETNDESRKKERISYKRKFLLSLSEKDVCKKLPNLPSEFNDLLLRDSEDPSPELLRISGDFPSHGLRRNDYSSSPPTKGEFGSHSRDIHGRWGGRSGGWNDKDGDLQSDRDPGDPGRRPGMPSRRPWQTPEHDGLLGKGSFPKPSGFGAGPAGPRPQSNDSYQLSRSNEPYHPPLPYKASPYNRRDTRDSFNDETFGSSESTSEDRAEEERRRRDSFELLRKEHQKAFQERQRLNPDLRKNDFDFTELLGESKDDKERPSRRDEVNNTPTIPVFSNPSFPSQSNAPRPLVPPGFASTILERKQGEKPQTETSQHERTPFDSKSNNMVTGTSVTNKEKPSRTKIGSSEILVEGEAVQVSSTDPSEQAIIMSSFLGISIDSVNKDKSFEKLSSISTTAEAQGFPRKIEHATVTSDQKKSLDISDGTSILDKLFNTATNLNSGDSSNITQENVENVEETQSPQTVKSSKFAHLFLEEDNKPVEELPSSRPPRGLLSLLQGADKLQSFDSKAKSELLMDFSLQGRDIKNTDQLSNTSTSKSVTAVPPVLTCEDLEQSILSEVGESYHLAPSPVDLDLSVSSVKNTKHLKTTVDDRASQHLLSLLQRSADPKSQDTPVTESRPEPSVKPSTAGEADPGKSLTLENLFGSAFMNELQSIGEPVSGRAMVTDAPGVPLRSERSISEVSQRKQIRPDGLPGGLLGLSENGNLLTVGDSAYSQKYMSFPGSHNQEPEVTINISDKLAALNSGPRNERPTMGGQDGQFFHHPQQYSTDRAAHLNGSGPAFHPLNSQHAHVKHQLDIMGSGSIIGQHHDPSPNHRFPPNMIHRPPFHHTTTSGLAEFDGLPPHMMQKMHMQDKLQHHHLMQGQHHPPHVKNQTPGLIPELHPSQRFPYGHRQPNYGITLGSHVNRVDHPASLQTLLGIHQRMEPSKQIPAMGQGGGGPDRQASMGHELDLGFGYR